MTSSPGRPISSRISSGSVRGRDRSAARRCGDERTTRRQPPPAAMRMNDPDAIAAEALARRASNHLLLLLDFDGTLADFDPDPAAVYLPPARREVLRALLPLSSVGIVSGRRLDDV